MEEIYHQALELHKKVGVQIAKLDFDVTEKRIKELEQQQQQSDFWKDNESAQILIQECEKLKRRIDPWKEITKNLNEIVQLAELNDDSVLGQLQNQLQDVINAYEQLKKDLKYSGPYDNNNAIINIFSGAGGTDAQDWAQMLERMYLRWAEQQSGVTAKVVSESVGDEAGIKSATLELSGPLIYGKLKGEHGVHRLVRLSPFNSDNLRQTSFAKFDVLPEIDQPEDVVIDEKDLKVDVYRAGGHGGQSVNTTDSAVRITHLPTGIVVAIQNERSQLQNKETAMTILRSRLAQLQIEQHKENVSEIKGPNEQAAWGNQIRNYVMHPYTMVKDTRTKHETADVQSVLNGDINGFIEANQNS